MPAVIAMAGYAEVVMAQALAVVCVLVFVADLLVLYGGWHRSMTATTLGFCGVVVLTLCIAPWEALPTLTKSVDPDDACWQAKLWMLAIFWFFSIVVAAISLAYVVRRSKQEATQKCKP